MNARTVLARIKEVKVVHIKAIDKAVTKALM